MKKILTAVLLILSISTAANAIEVKYLGDKTKHNGSPARWYGLSAQNKEEVEKFGTERVIMFISADCKNRELSVLKIGVMDEGDLIVRTLGNPMSSKVTSKTSDETVFNNLCSTDI